LAGTVQPGFGRCRLEAHFVGILTKNMYNIMHASLGKRNAAAHPNAVVIDQLQTDAFITDLIVNVVQKIV
jgi:hypothetical protein